MRIDSRKEGRMAFTTHLLVVANRTADSPELLEALRQRSESSPVRVTMLVPAAWSERAAAEQRLESAVTSLVATGIQADGMVGDADPIVAVQETWDPGRFDEVVVSTLTEGTSRWLQIDLPHRIARLTDCHVRHVAVPERSPDEHPTMPPPARRPMLERVASLMRSSTHHKTA